jgi:hypothetical protein
VLQGIYQWKDVEVAKKLFGNWCAWVKAMREQAGELLERNRPAVPSGG